MSESAPSGPPKTRQVVQLAVASSDHRDDTLVALCNDGSIWIMVWGADVGKEHWARLAAIPQE